MKAPKAGFAKYTYGKIQFKGEIYEKEEIDPYIAYQKYKRCEAIANGCDEAFARECLMYPEEMTDNDFWKQQIEFYPRWRDKWLELAEKFKEATK